MVISSFVQTFLANDFSLWYFSDLRNSEKKQQNSYVTMCTNQDITNITWTQMFPPENKSMIGFTIVVKSF